MNDGWMFALSSVGLHLRLAVKGSLSHELCSILKHTVHQIVGRVLRTEGRIFRL